MAPKAPKYILVPASHSFCPYCSANTRLLWTDEPDLPTFHLCRCGFVGQVGVAEVKEEP